MSSVVYVVNIMYGSYAIRKAPRRKSILSAGSYMPCIVNGNAEAGAKTDKRLLKEKHPDIIMFINIGGGARNVCVARYTQQQRGAGALKADGPSSIRRRNGNA